MIHVSVGFLVVVFGGDGLMGLKLRFGIRSEGRGG